MDEREVLLEGGDGQRYRVPVQGSIGGQVTFTLRQDKISLKKESPADSNELQENSLKGKITLIEYKGMEVSLGLEVLDFKEFGVIISEKDFQMLSPDLGTQLIASWSKEDVHVLKDLPAKS
jgi:ABC-type Fe3+/spermidine/putrescine transport system ATPase subunit